MFFLNLCDLISVEAEMAFLVFERLYNLLPLNV